ncbi:MAG: flagellar hook-basal body complex protein FliE [Oscillospiraceae bacterium]|nr:flagellar hook-basal body complex protein FliE [Oscillospiraceae bacterium]
MSINPITPNIMHLFNTEPLRVDNNQLTNASGSFADILSESMNTAEVTDFIDKGSTLELMMGETDDFASLLIDIQKAELSLNLALQIRNKVIDAYNEVMRMSV